MVRGSVEETLNELPEAEVEKLTQSARYERSEARQVALAGVGLACNHQIPTLLHPLAFGQFLNDSGIQQPFRVVDRLIQIGMGIRISAIVAFRKAGWPYIVQGTE